MNTISKNFQHHIAHIPEQTRHMQVVHLRNLTYVNSGLSCDTFNIIHIHNGAALTEAEMMEAIHHFQYASLDYCIWITQEGLAKETQDLLSKAGVEQQAAEIGMILDLSEYVPRFSEEQHNIQIVDTPSQLEDYASVISENWTPPDQNVLSFYQNSANAWLNPVHKMILLVYYVGEKAVSVVELCPSDKQTIGLYGFATLEAHRGRGIGSALMTYSLNLAQQQGFQHAVLQATEDGIGIYKKMGFKEVTTFYEYA
jgi:ribosomal protein S18 acetylase RimI-like enzyme